MTAAVLLLWASCVWSIVRSVLCLLLIASPWRRVLTLGTVLLAACLSHKPRERML